MLVDEVFDRRVVGPTALTKAGEDEWAAEVGDVIGDADVGAHPSVSNRLLDERRRLTRSSGDELVAHRFDLGVPVGALDHGSDDAPDDSVEQFSAKRFQFGDEIRTEVAGDRRVVHISEVASVSEQRSPIREMAVHRVAAVPRMLGDALMGDRIPALVGKENAH